MNSPNTSVAVDQLRSFVERIERLDEEIKGLNDDKRDVYAEAKGNGYDVKALKEIVRIRRRDPGEVAESSTILATYMQALNMTFELPTAAAAAPATARSNKDRWEEETVPA
jgi:uncharacterized protein (UPF0335 family)